MNTVPVIAASCFTAVAVFVLLYFILSKKPLFAGKLKLFFRACAAVYLSGTILILFLAAVLNGVPLAFILISEVTIMTVYVVTLIIIIRLSKTLAKMAVDTTPKPEQEENIDE